MVCIYCSDATQVVNSRTHKKSPSIWRRRSCSGCKQVFTTKETPDLDQLKVENNKSARKPFIEAQIYADIQSAISHRKNSLMDAKALSATVINSLLPARNGIIKSAQIKASIIEVLQRFDKAAASYYKARH